MSSVSQVGKQMQWVLEERACVLARETGCVKRQRKFSGADLVQMVVFGFQQHPHASLEELASTAELREVSVTDTAVYAGVCALDACGVGGVDQHRRPSSPGGADQAAAALQRRDPAREE